MSRHEAMGLVSPNTMRDAHPVIVQSTTLTEYFIDLCLFFPATPPEEYWW
jgi:hypothetical protein